MDRIQTVFEMDPFLVESNPELNGDFLEDVPLSIRARCFSELLDSPGTAESRATAAMELLETDPERAAPSARCRTDREAAERVTRLSRRGLMVAVATRV